MFRSALSASRLTTPRTLARAAARDVRDVEGSAGPTRTLDYRSAPFERFDRFAGLDAAARVHAVRDRAALCAAGTTRGTSCSRSGART